MNYSPFNEKQVAYFNRSLSSWLNVLEGGKRASKNLLNIICFAECVDAHKDKLHFIGGVTRAAARVNIVDSNGFGLEHLWRGRCKRGTFEGVECINVRTKNGVKHVLFFGCKDKDSFAAFKGFSFGSAYMTEVNECHQIAFQEVFDRTLASSRRQLFFDLNSKSPKHWFYRDFLDYQDQLKRQGKNEGYNYEHMTIWDNMSLSNTQLREALATYDKDSLWYKADILGLRTAATGRIYTHWGIKNIRTLEQMKNSRLFEKFSIGIDVGGTAATVATLVGISKGHKDVCILDGYYDRQGKDRDEMTHSRYAKEIVRCIKHWSTLWPAIRYCTIFAESADKQFRRELANQLVMAGLESITVVPSYKKEGILARIRLQHDLIYQGRLLVATHLEEWVEAYEQAVWDQKTREKGEWVRVDNGTYPVDCLDSCEYAIQPFAAALTKGGTL